MPARIDEPPRVPGRRRRRRCCSPRAAARRPSSERRAGARHRRQRARVSARSAWRSSRTSPTTPQRFAFILVNNDRRLRERPDGDARDRASERASSARRCPRRCHTEGLPEGPRRLRRRADRSTTPGNWRGKVTIEGQPRRRARVPGEREPGHADRRRRWRRVVATPDHGRHRWASTRSARAPTTRTTRRRARSTRRRSTR